MTKLRSSNRMDAAIALTLFGREADDEANADARETDSSENRVASRS